LTLPCSGAACARSSGTFASCASLGLAAVTPFSSTRLSRIVERNAQLAAQTCTDVALHIVAASGRASPETYADALRALADLGIVTAELADRLAGAARLRNLLVHGYLDVDHGRLFDELGWIDEAAAFGTAIERWLETLPATS
jgi:uncharacterized protein YutE (UPF0331/DUF86 family)